MTVKEMLERITSEEITDWMAYYSLKRKDEKKVIEEAQRRHR